MSSLTVNVDLSAVVRSIARQNEPDPAQVAMLSEMYGANGVSVQFRRDRKYIRERDLYLLKGVVKSKLIIELPPNEESIQKVTEIKPWMVMFAADHADSDSPLSPVDFNNAPIEYSSISNQFSAIGVNVGYFIEPDSDEVKGAARAQASGVLINCSGYTKARSMEDAQRELDRIDKAAQTAEKNNLTIYAGRGLNYKNIQPLVEIGLIDEFIIGHAIASRAMLVGYERAVTEMTALIRKS